MKQERRRRFGNERGGTLVLVAISMVVILAAAALAVDLAAAFAWRAEAQKIADSAALAGASVFLDALVLDEAAATAEAEARAEEYALYHTIKKDPVQESEVTVEVLFDEEKVRVYIARLGLPTWFARIIGIGSIDIRAVAAAQAFAAGESRCLKPLALADLWSDGDDDTGSAPRIWEPTEDWEYGSSEADSYQRYELPEVDENGNPIPVPASTGYGSDFRNGYADASGQTYENDYGRPVQLKSADPNDPYNFSPGIFFPWRIPSDPNQAECDQGGGGGGSGGQGGAEYRQNLCECNNSPVELFTPYDLEPGNMIGPTQQGVGELIAEDPNVYWDPNAYGGDGGPVRPTEDGTGIEEVGLSSPRVIKIALFDPSEIDGSGMQSIEFNNFALLFLEEQGSGQDPVMARFMYFASGEGAGSAGPTQGSLVKYLRLVE